VTATQEKKGGEVVCWKIHLAAPPEKAAAIYRRSDSRQEDSISRQRKAVPDYARRQGYRLVDEYVFDGIPGDEMDNTPEWRRLLADAQAGKWQVLVADEPSRLSRDDYDDFVALVKRPLDRLPEDYR
jgi:DNA invertase Pin-like site-specific DNA recombinase